MSPPMLKGPRQHASIRPANSCSPTSLPATPFAARVTSEIATDPRHRPLDHFHRLRENSDDSPAVMPVFHVSSPLDDVTHSSSVVGGGGAHLNPNLEHFQMAVVGQLPGLA